MNFLGGMKILWIFGGGGGGKHKNGLYLGVISMHFMFFFKGQGTEWGIFWGVAKLSNIFGVLEIPYFLYLFIYLFFFFCFWGVG